MYKIIAAEGTLKVNLNLDELFGNVKTSSEKRIKHNNATFRLTKDLALDYEKKLNAYLSEFEIGKQQKEKALDFVIKFYQGDLIKQD